jgi:hypothetical protein
MASYRNKPRDIEAITFEELVEYGKAHSKEFINGLPKFFEYNHHPIQYENDTTYLIPTLESGDCAQKFTVDDMLIIGLKGEIYPCKKDIFEETYEQL